MAAKKTKLIFNSSTTMVRWSNPIYQSLSKATMCWASQLKPILNSMIANWMKRESLCWKQKIKNFISHQCRNMPMMDRWWARPKQSYTRMRLNTRAISQHWYLNKSMTPRFQIANSAFSWIPCWKVIKCPTQENKAPNSQPTKTVHTICQTPFILVKIKAIKTF